MNTLAIDNSNGRTKLALFNGADVCSEVRSLSTSELGDSDALRALLNGWRFERVCCSSVVPPAAEQLRTFFGARCPFLTLSTATAPGVDFSRYPGKSTLGQDRVADAVAAAAGGVENPLLIIDAGTAVTLDVLLPGEPPCFTGGVIAPGLKAMAQALGTSAAQLYVPEKSFPEHAVGRNTEEALQNGIVRGYAAMITGLAEAIARELSAEPRCLLTGGDAAMAASQLLFPHTIDPLLTLRGIALCADASRA